MRKPAAAASSKGTPPDTESGAHHPSQRAELPALLDHPVDLQTIRQDPSGSVWTDEAPNVSRPDPSGADQIDAEHQATDLAVGGSNPSRRAKRPGHTAIGGSTARLAEATVNDLPDSRLRRGYTPLAPYPGPSNQRNRQRRPACRAPVACLHCAGPAALSGIPSQPIRTPRFYFVLAIARISAGWAGWGASGRSPTSRRSGAGPAWRRSGAPGRGRQQALAVSPVARSGHRLVPSPPSRWSPPGPPRRVSSPGPPESTSTPSPPASLSSPVPP